MLKFLKKCVTAIRGYFRRESIMEEEERIFGKKEVDLEDLKEELQKPTARLSEPVILDVPKPRPAIQPIEPNPKRRTQTAFYDSAPFATISAPKKDKE